MPLARWRAAVLMSYGRTRGTVVTLILGLSPILTSGRGVRLAFPSRVLQPPGCRRSISGAATIVASQNTFPGSGQFRPTVSGAVAPVTTRGCASDLGAPHARSNASVPLALPIPSAGPLPYVGPAVTVVASLPPPPHGPPTTGAVCFDRSCARVVGEGSPASSNGPSFSVPFDFVSSPVRRHLWSR